MQQMINTISAANNDLFKILKSLYGTGSILEPFTQKEFILPLSY